MRRAYFLLILLVAVYIASRFSIIFFGSSHIFHPYFDESVSGTLTFDLLQGTLRAPFMAYQYEQRSGDSMIETLLMYPLAALFGHSMFTIKLCALLCSLACMLGWVYLIRRCCGMPAALLFALFFALPPPMFARLGLIGTFSSHHMINQILVLQLICLFHMFEKEKRDVPLLLWLALGLCAGLGIYAFYSYIIFNVFCLLFVLCCRPAIISVRGVAAFCLGGLIGFLPWLWRSVFYSTGGGNFLLEIFTHISVSPWAFAQTFFHTVPYTLGYGYPLREIGWFGILFSLLLLCMFAVIVRESVRVLSRIRACSLHGRLAAAGPQVWLWLVAAFFPVFFLLCLTLSPMQVSPLEYWPTIGIFATFAPADVIRCRWITILFPLYCAMSAIGLSIILGKKPRFLKAGAWCVVIVLVAVNAVRMTQMLSFEDVHRIFLYKGYNFDQYAGRLLALPRGARQLSHAEEIVEGYPEEYREEACRSLGTRLAYAAVHRENAGQMIIGYLERVPADCRGPLVYGILRILHAMPEQEAQPWVRALAGYDPEMFYANWGAQVLGYRYYGFLVNRRVLLDHLPVSEQFFFRTFLTDFATGMRHEYARQFVDRLRDYEDRDIAELLMQDIRSVPDAFRPQAVQGLGRLVGAEMLFDTLHVPDYPLNSSAGYLLDEALREYFFTGVGNGFAETLCRYWRRLMPPGTIDDARYARGLEIEWRRCIDLMHAMPPDLHSVIWEGFVQELQARTLNEHIRAFIDEKLTHL